MLPANWATTTLGNILELTTGKLDANAAKEEGEYPFFTCGREVLRIDRFAFDQEAVLLAGNGDFNVKHYIGKFNAYQRTYVLRPLTVDGRFLFLLVKLHLPQITFNERGSTVRYIRKGDIEDTKIDIAPLPEQKRIVAKIDSFSAKSKRAREHLDHIPRLAEKYKQAILAAAYRGDLTSTGRPSEKGGVKTPSSKHIDARLSNLPELPSSWWWQSISEVMGVSGGLIKNPKRTAMETQRSYLRVANVYANELRLSEISRTGCTDREFEKTKLASGDLLIVEGNGSLEQIGRVAVWNGDIKECSHQNHIIRARPSEAVEPRFALFWLLSPAGREAIETIASSSSGLHTLSITKVGGLPIPLCAKSEQLAIVRLIDNAFGWIDRLATETTSARRLIDHLDQAILSKAFQGELVPQDLNDEPASVLLERIKAEREGSGGSKALKRSRK